MLCHAVQGANLVGYLVLFDVAGEHPIRAGPLIYFQNIQTGDGRGCIVVQVLYRYGAAIAVE
ncbi:MAG: hypothetical protein BWX93_01980 [Bacteroidetes bacterium ADurb.Bin139]|nr:MAG: hypothetical protein BWX93_01980 [Bacteroidetes bacterium ADurb.Bin139]